MTRLFIHGTLQPPYCLVGMFPWKSQFLEADLKTPLPRLTHFTSPDKIPELVERGGGFPDQESRLMLEHRIAKGRGWVFLSLTEEAVREAQATSGCAPVVLRCVVSRAPRIVGRLRLVQFGLSLAAT
jgi:hypothetical protein